MSQLFETIRDVPACKDVLRRRRYGVIESRNGRLVHVQLKPWPKLGSLLEAHWIRSMKSKRHAPDVCRLFYSQPMGHRNFLALSYFESSLKTTWETVGVALKTLDQIACLKQSDAILAEVTNRHISDRALNRMGWERHLEHKRKRHWIKRFYGEYPVAAIKAVG